MEVTGLLLQLKPAARVSQDILFVLLPAATVSDPLALKVA